MADRRHRLRRRRPRGAVGGEWVHAVATAGSVSFECGSRCLTLFQSGMVAVGYMIWSAGPGWHEGGTGCIWLGVQT